MSTNPRARDAEIRADIARLEAEMHTLNADAGDKPLTTGQQTRWDDLKRAVDKKREELDTVRDQIRADLVRRFEAGTISGDKGDQTLRDKTFGFNRNGDPFVEPTSNESALEIRSRAARAIEDRWNAEDGVKEGALATLKRVGADTDQQSSLADVRGVAAHVLRYSDPLYVSAFRKYAKDPETYVADLTPEEARAWRSAREEQRATLQTTGAVLPSPMDPTIVLTNAGTQDPMRQVARIDTTVSKAKRYITSAGSTFSFDAELTEVSDDTHTETEVEITTRKAQGWIQATIETFMDQPEFSTEVVKIIADGKARLEGSKFITGASGSNEPIGIETKLTGGASEVNSAGEALDADDVYGLLEALPARWRPNAAWQLELSTRNFIHRLHNPSGTEPPLIENGRLIDLPYHLNSNVDPYSSVNAAASASNMVLFVGDWSQYVILDRVGLSVAFVGPGILQNTSNNLPDGRVGWYAYWRVGADALTINAFRMLDVATTA
jgi:HK97 family phage major capsid protein